MENEDLFWALRGAGHNFGIVTSFEYRLHTVGPVLGGMVIHPIERAVDVLRFYRDFTANPPGELTAAFGILTAPNGNLAAAIVACYSGSLDAGARVLVPLREFGPDRRRYDRYHTLHGHADDDRCRIPVWTVELLENGPVGQDQR